MKEAMLKSFKDILFSWFKYIAVVVVPSVVIDKILGGQRLLKFDSIIARGADIDLTLLIAITLFVYSIPVVIILFVLLRLMERFAIHSGSIRAICGIVSGFMTFILVFVTTFCATNSSTIIVSAALGVGFGIFMLHKKRDLLVGKSGLTSASS